MGKSGFSWSQVFARRLGRHGLAEPLAGAGPADVARAMCGAHAQVMSAAELAIGLRGEGLTRSAVRRALWTERTLVKAYGPRGTVFLLPAADLPLWIGVLAALPMTPQRLPDHVRMTPEQIDEVFAAMTGALADPAADEGLTTDELTQALVDRVGSWAGDPVMEAFQGKWPRWRQVQHLAGIRGVLLFGPQRGRNVTFTSPQRWLPGFAPADNRSAIGTLIGQFLNAYGPATPQQFAHYLNVPRTWAVQQFQERADELEPVEIEGTQAWVSAGDADPPTEPPHGVRLLPYFDPYAYAVGNHPRERLYPGKAAQRAAGNFQVLVIDGAVAGVWHQRRSGRKIAITVEALVPLPPPRLRALEEQVTRIGEIMEGTPELTLGTVTVGGHA